MSKIGSIATTLLIRGTSASRLKPAGAVETMKQDKYLSDTYNKSVSPPLPTPNQPEKHPQEILVNQQKDC